MELRQEVENDIIENKKNDIKHLMHQKRKYIVISSRLEILCHILLICNGLCSFISSELYNGNWLAFSAGVISVICIGLTRLCILYQTKSKEKNKILGDLLNSIGLNEQVDLTGDISIPRHNTPQDNL